MAVQTQDQDAQPEEEKNEIPESENGGRPKSLSDRIFEDPAIQLAAKEDPIFIFFQNWWRQILVVVAIVLAYQYGVDKFRQTYEASMKRSSEVFSRVRSEFNELKGFSRQLEKNSTELATLKSKLVAKGNTETPLKEGEPEANKDTNEADQKQIDQIEKRLSDAQKNFNESKRKLGQYLEALADAKEPYSQIAVLYNGLVAHTSGDIEAMKSVLSGFSWESVTDLESNDRFLSELAASSLARALLEEDATYEEGKALLTKLANQGYYTHVTAAVTLARLAQTADEKKEVATILESILSKEDEQTNLIEPELERLQN